MKEPRRLRSLEFCHSRLSTLLDRKILEAAAARGVLREAEAAEIVDALESIRHRHDTLMRYQVAIRKAIEAEKATEKPGVS